jgi:hypothetical protein
VNLKSRIQNYSNLNNGGKTIIAKDNTAASTPVESNNAVPPLTFELLTSKEMEYKEKIHEKLMEILDL